MHGDSTLIDLERSAWDALTTSGEAAGAFYDAVLADEVLMLLPGALVIDDRQTVIDSMKGSPWDSVELSHERVTELTDSCAVVSYEASATRNGTEYQALFNSTYVRDDGEWKLALHQQTPLGQASGST